MQSERVVHPIQGKRRSARIALFSVTLLILLRTLFGLAFSLATPVWESYDEPAHFAYALEIARDGRLPAEDDPIPNPERIQPPIYYLALAGALKVSNSTLEGFRYPEQNPYFAYGTSGKNYALHPLNPPPADKAIEVSLLFLRFLSLLITLPGIAFTYRAARAIWRQAGARRDWSTIGGASVLCVTALVALWPQAIFNSAVVGNDGPALMFGALITWLVLALRPKESRRRTLVRLLVALGAVLIGTAVKLNLILFAAPVALAVLLTASPVLIAILLSVGALTIGGLLFVLQSSPAILIPLFKRDGAGMTFAETLVSRAIDPSTGPFIGQALRYGLDSSFGLFGWGNVPLAAPINSVYMLVLALAGVGLLTLVARIGLRHWNYAAFGRQGQFLLLLGSVGAVISGALVLASFYMTIHLVPGRYLLPALPAFAALLVLGWQALSLRPLRWATVGAMLIVNAVIPAAVFGPTYGIPPAVDAAAITHPLDTEIELAPDVYLLGWGLPQRDAYVGDDFALDLYWRAAAPLTVRYSFKVEVVGPDGQGYALLETLPGGGNYLSTDWTPGRIFRDRVFLQVRKDYPAPGVGRFRVSVLPRWNTTGDSPTGRVPLAEFGTVSVHTRNEPEVAIPARDAALFHDGALLRGLKVAIPMPTKLVISLTWEVRSRLPDGTLFIHVRCREVCPDPAGLLAAQKDSQPRAGTYPTSFWLPGEFIGDEITIDLPAALPVGRYPINLGIYDTVGQRRWPIRYAAALQTVDDVLGIGVIDVAADGTRVFRSTYPDP